MFPNNFRIVNLPHANTVLLSLVFKLKHKHKHKYLRKQVNILATYRKHKHKKNGHVHSSCTYALNISTRRMNEE